MQIQNTRRLEIKPTATENAPRRGKTISKLLAAIKSVANRLGWRLPSRKAKPAQGPLTQNQSSMRLVPQKAKSGPPRRRQDSETGPVMSASHPPKKPPRASLDRASFQPVLTPRTALSERTTRGAKPPVPPKPLYLSTRRPLAPVPMPRTQEAPRGPKPPVPPKPKHLSARRPVLNRSLVLPAPNAPAPSPPPKPARAAAITMAAVASPPPKPPRLAAITVAVADAPLHSPKVVGYLLKPVMPA